jgi:hypothetical protein
MYYNGKHTSFCIHSNEIGLELNVKETKYMVMSQDQHAVQNHNTHTHTSFERVECFKYLGTSLSYQNSIHEEIKCRLQSGNYHHHRLYNPGWALASSSKCCQHPLSRASTHQFLQPSFLVSSSTPSIQIDSVSHIVGNLQSLSTVSF